MRPVAAELHVLFSCAGACDNHDLLDQVLHQHFEDTSMHHTAVPNDIYRKHLQPKIKKKKLHI